MLKNMDFLQKWYKVLFGTQRQICHYFLQIYKIIPKEGTKGIEILHQNIIFSEAART